MILLVEWTILCALVGIVEGVLFWLAWRVTATVKYAVLQILYRYILSVILLWVGPLPLIFFLVLYLSPNLQPLVSAWPEWQQILSAMAPLVLGTGCGLGLFEWLNAKTNPRTPTAVAG
ncbi:MAG: hypothetical protein JO261_07640 [Alphaproteobacteria bacterium]|nr:hypothetical protein [Alphaproteobacteria bacterium]MBV9693555.1 hypothetical protein [Alphaproteobacteria bacterium]